MRISLLEYQLSVAIAACLSRTGTFLWVYYGGYRWLEGTGASHWLNYYF